LGEELAKAQDITRRTVDEIRTLLYELRPLVLETEGLVAAVRAFLKRRQKEIADRTEVSLSVRVFGPDGTFLIDEEKVKTALFAILQEAVNNAIKHAEAANIAVVLGETATDFYMMVSDDGQGFETQDVLIKSARQGSLGMINLHERAELIGANLRLKSRPGKGTRIVIRVPRAVEVRQKNRGSTGTLRPIFFKNTDTESRT
jgi:signal transduction histidine kinase